MIKDKPILLNPKRSQPCANHIIIRRLVITIRNSVGVVNEARKSIKCEKGSGLNGLVNLDHSQARSVLQANFSPIQHLGDDIILPKGFYIVTT
jgi:hypothetical protein